MYSEDQQREKKQNYLRSNILDIGYDPQLFINFCSQCDPEKGGDIDQWEYIELRAIVKKFLEKHPFDENQQSNEYQENYGQDQETYDYQQYDNNEQTNIDNQENYVQEDNNNYNPDNDTYQQEQPDTTTNNDIQYEQTKQPSDDYCYSQPQESPYQEKKESPKNNTNQQQENIQIQQQVTAQPNQSIDLQKSAENKYPSFQSSNIPSTTITPQPKQEIKKTQEKSPFEGLMVPPQMKKQSPQQSNQNSQNQISTPKSNYNNSPSTQQQSQQKTPKQQPISSQFSQQQSDPFDFNNIQQQPNKQLQQNKNQGNNMDLFQDFNSGGNTKQPTIQSNIQQQSKPQSNNFDDDLFGDFNTAPMQSKPQQKQQNIPNTNTKQPQQQQQQDMFDDFGDFSTAKPQNKQQSNNNTQAFVGGAGVVAAAGTALSQNNNQNKKNNNDFDFDFDQFDDAKKQEIKSKNTEKKDQDKDKEQKSVSDKLKGLGQNLKQSATTAVAGASLYLSEKKEEVQQKLEEKKQENEKDQELQSSGISPDQLADVKYKQSHTCKQLKESSLGQKKKDIQIQILNTQLVEGSLFSASYYVYIIMTYPQKWEVKRKFQDFEWLHKTLQKFFPSIAVPPLHQVSGLTSKINKQMVSKRQNYLEHFLNQCTKSPEILNSLFFKQFLEIDNDKMFSQCKKEVDKMSRPKFIQDLHSMNGKVDSIISSDHQKFATSYELYLNQQHNAYMKLKKLSKQMVDDYNKLANTMYEIGDVFGNMTQNTQKFNDGIGTNKSLKVQQLEDTYTILNNMIVTQANQIISQSKQTDEHFVKFFKFQKDNMETVKPLLQQRNKYGAEFVKKKNEPGQKSSFMKNLTQNSKIPIQDTGKDLKTLQDQFGYYDSQLIKESNRILKEQWKTNAQHFNMFSSLQKSITQEMGIIWDDIGNHFSNQNKTGEKQNIDIISRKGQNEDKKK